MGLGDRFFVGCSGNLGRGHEFATVIAAAECLRGDQSLCCLFIGGCQEFAELVQVVREHGLGPIFHLPTYQERRVLKHSLGVSDVHLISLRPELEGLIVPSKFHGIAAAGRPIIIVAAADGEVAGLGRSHDCGIVLEPSDGECLAEALRSLGADPKRLAAMGRRARAMLDNHLSRRHAFACWQRLVEEIAGSAAVRPSRRRRGLLE